MKLDHLSPAQLTYLEGLVEKSAEMGVDPNIVIKLAAGFGSEVMGGLKDVGNEITTGLSETPFMQWMGNVTDSGTPEQFKGVDEYNAYIKKTRGLADQSALPGAAKTMKPEDMAQGQYYQKMLDDKGIQAAGSKDYGPKGWARVGRAFTQLNPFGRAERETRYGAEQAQARAQGQRQAIMQYQSKNPFKMPEPKAGKPMPIPGLQYTPYNEPYNYKGLYQAV